MREKIKDREIVIKQVTEEREELEQKIEKLKKLAMSEEFNKLDTATQGQLLSQLYHMSEYSNALMYRIIYLRGKKPKAMILKQALRAEYLSREEKK